MTSSSRRFVWLSFLLPAIAFGNAGGDLKSRNPGRVHDLRFTSLAKSWDEGFPLGNGMIGALVWQREGVLRMSLDRADLWDLRKVKEFEGPEFRFAWVVEQALSGDYNRVHEMGDVPYDRDAAPTKLPGAALEIPIPDINDVESVELQLQDALCIVRWKNGVRFETFVHATEPVGWFRIKGLPSRITPRLVPPPYALIDSSNEAGNSGPGGNDLRRLGYPPPEISQRTYDARRHQIRYHQQGWNGFSYDVQVDWSVRSRQYVERVLVNSAKQALSFEGDS